MNPTSVTVHVPATTANLGPGFDSLALALDLWNHTEFTLAGDCLLVEIDGEGKAALPCDGTNLIASAAKYFYEHFDILFPKGLLIRCTNGIPLGSGLGSSAAATLTGLLGANRLSGSKVKNNEILKLASDLEGHADNVAACLHGGIIVVFTNQGVLQTYRAEIPELNVAVVVPEINLPTMVARSVLPTKVPLEDAVFNLARCTLVFEALRNGDLTLLGEVMDDRLHQPYRLKLIPGAVDAFQAATQAGAAAAVISGAGPGIIAFGGLNIGQIGNAMQGAFSSENIRSQVLLLSTANKGAWISDII
jgi:homoserine kinase